MTTHIASPSGPRLLRPGVILIVLFALLQFASADPPTTKRFVEGELLVKFRGGPKGADARFARGQTRHEVKRDFDFIGWQHIRLSQGLSVEDGLRLYRNMPGVMAAEPNGFLQFADAPRPNDTMAVQQWAMGRIGATNAWAVSTGNSNVVVAVIDSGVNYNHEDLAANMWRNPGEIPGNGIDDDGNGFVDDVYGINAATGSTPFDLGFIALNGTVIYHGTGCAGIVGAVGNNNKGVTGVNWSVRILAIRLNDEVRFVRVSDVIAAFDYVTMMKRRGVNIRVTSNSYYATDSPFNQALKDAVDAAGNEGVLNVFVCGNFSTNIDVSPIYPAAFDSANILTVAASDQLDNLASFSSYGRTNVDLAAPGVDLVTTYGPSNTAYYTTFGGTSGATPHVAGAAALLISAYPSATMPEVKAALLDSVDVFPAFTNKMVSNGRLNVERAMQLLGERLSSAPPNITFQPQSQTVVLSNSFGFNTVVTGARPLNLQWRLNGAAMSGSTNAAYGKPAGAESDAGDYVLVASNAFGTVTSAVARLSVLTTPVFLATPQNRVSPETSNVTFTASATGYLPQYHWQFFGTNLPGRTGTNLTLTNISPALEGPYTAVASNAYGMTTSAVATLTVLTFPRIVEPEAPLRLAVVPGETVTLGVRTTGTLPIGYRWRRATFPTAIMTNDVLDAHEFFLTFVITNAGTYTLVLTNAAIPIAASQRTNAIITLLADNDGDGLPDNWEADYPTAADPDGDADADGLSNLLEYRAGTNPTNAASGLRIESFAPGETGPALTFTALSNRTYTIQYRERVDTGSWQTLSNIIGSATNRIVEVSDPRPPGVSTRFYRLVTPQAP